MLCSYIPHVYIAADLGKGWGGGHLMQMQLRRTAWNRRLSLSRRMRLGHTTNSIIQFQRTPVNRIVLVTNGISLQITNLRTSTYSAEETTSPGVCLFRYHEHILESSREHNQFSKIPFHIPFFTWFLPLNRPNVFHLNTWSTKLG